MKITTLCFLKRDNKVLLAMKKRGFGMGKFNGVGGKVEAGESVVDAAIRETEEEISSRLKHTHLVCHAKLSFSFENKPDWNQECFVFISDTWEKEPAESEEMAPEWFSIAELPFERMWVDDPHWLPKVLSGKKLKARFHFDEEGEKILVSDVTEVADINLP